jgi:hypothetical protein
MRKCTYRYVNLLYQKQHTCHISLVTSCIPCTAQTTAHSATTHMHSGIAALSNQWYWLDKIITLHYPLMPTMACRSAKATSYFSHFHSFQFIVQFFFIHVPSDYLLTTFWNILLIFTYVMEVMSCGERPMKDTCTLFILAVTNVISDMKIRCQWEK